MTPENAIRTMIDRRRPGASICPSDAARLVDPKNWRDRMAQIRAAASRMIEGGEIVATQHGKIVDITTARGPIRLARA